ncbi:MAG: leucine-rich repeat domain-containing protein [Lachnospiraceae bacterium]|nr:leucine-rich repeat domain-containing protein [Lachnospiraceae bacterium]
MERTRKLLGIIMTIAVCMGLGVFVSAFTTHAERNDADTLYIAEVFTNDEGEVMLPENQEDINDMGWYKPDEWDGYVHWEAFSHKKVVFAYKDNKNDMIIITAGIDKMSVTEADCKTHKKFEEWDKRLSDFIRQYEYDKWEEGAEEPERIDVPGVFEMGLYDAWFVIEYNGYSMTICSDKPNVGIYIRHVENESSWFEYAAWDHNFEYEEDVEYYIGCSYYLEQDETLDDGSINISLEGTEKEGFKLSNVNAETQIVDADMQMVYRLFTVEHDFIKSFDLEAIFKYKTNKTEVPRVEQNGFVAFAKREGLVITNTDCDGPFRDNYRDYKKSTDQYVRDECWVSLGFVDSEGNTVEPVLRAEGENPLANFTITRDEGEDGWQDASNDATISTTFEGDRVTQDGVYLIKLNKCGTYRITYKKGTITSFVEVKAVLPNIGVYKGNEAIDENLLGDPTSEVEYEPGETYYVIMSPDMVEEAKNKLDNEDLSRLEISFDEVMLDNPSEVKTRTWSNKTDPTWWGFTISDDCIATMRPGIRAEWVYKGQGDEEGGREEIRQINLFAVRRGLVISEAFYDYGRNPYPEQHNELSKSYDAERCCENEVNLGITDDGVNITKINADDTNKFKILKDGEAVDANVASITPVKQYNEEACEDLPVDGYFVLNFYEIGTYTLEYNETSVVEIHVKEPTVAIYDTEGTLIGGKVEYTNTDREFTVKVYEQEDNNVHEEITIKDVIFKEGTDDFVDCDIAADGKSFKITLAEPKIRRFAIAVNLERTWINSEGIGGGVRDEESRWLNFEPGDDICEVYLDGEPQQGFSGCYIPEDWFINGNWTSDSQYPMYWVHAKSVQDVINKLSETAVGDKFEGYYMGPDGNFVKASENVNIVNTGYIAVFPSTYGGEALEPQYVASSGNLKGISFGSFSNHDYFVKPDAAGNYRTITKKSGGSGDFVEMGVLDAKSVKEYLQSADGLTSEQETAFDNASAVTLYKGAVYSLDVESGEYTSRDGVHKEYRNYTFKNTTPIIGGFSDKEETKIVKNVESLQVCENFVGLHVNAYCDMKFVGDMGKLVIGYPDKNLSSKNGQYFDTKIGDFCKLQPTEEDPEHHRVQNLYRDINGPTAYPNGTVITQPNNGTGLVDGEGHDAQERFYEYDTNIDYSYRLITYAIDSESEVTGTLDGVDVIVPEPNALTELSYEQKDAIEAGGKLTVSMTADELDENTASESSKEGIEAIKNEMSEDEESEYGRVDYIDLSVKASVGEEETAITETAVPMEVTIPIPKGYKKNTNFRIARYHKDKNGKTEVFFLDRVDSLRGEIGLNIGYVENDDNTLTFFTDRFSTYALMEVGGDSRTEIDLSKTAWNYTGVFTADGNIKKVELTGVPENVDVTYSGNQAKEAGKYTAKATFTVKDAKAYKLPATIPDELKTLEWEIKAAEPAPTPSPTPAPTPSPTPAPAEVGQTITDTSGASKGETFTVTGTGDNATVTYAGQEAGNTDTTLVIPDAVVGADGKEYAVTEIAPGALKGNTTVEEVKTGDNIQVIGDGAFQDVKKLKKTTIGKNVKIIGANAFSGCGKLATIKVNGKKLTTIKAKAFYKTAAKNVDLSKSPVETIEKNVFGGCKNLKVLKVKGKSLKKVGKNAIPNKKGITVNIVGTNKEYKKAVKAIKASGAKKVRFKRLKK